MANNHPDSFDDLLNHASGQGNHKPSQRVWKGIASHFDRVDRIRKMWHTSIFAVFTIICALSAYYIGNQPDHFEFKQNLSQLHGIEINKSSTPKIGATGLSHSEKQLKLSNDNFLFERESSNYVQNGIKQTTPNFEDILNLPQPAKKYHVPNIYTSTEVPQINPVSYRPKKKANHKGKWMLGMNLGYANHQPIITQFPNTQQYAGSYSNAMENIRIASLNTVQLGLNISYKLSKHWNILSGVNIYKMGVSYQVMNASNNVINSRDLKSKEEIYYNSFWISEIPLTFNYMGSLKKNWNITLGTGIALQSKIPSLSNDGGFHVLQYGRSTNGLALVNFKIGKEFKNIQIAAGPSIKYQLLNTSVGGNYKLLQTSAELSIGFKL